MKITQVTFEQAAWEDYQYWQMHDKKLLKRLNNIIRDTCREPFSGIGKPERLKENLQGFWLCLFFGGGMGRLMGTSLFYRTLPQAPTQRRTHYTALLRKASPERR